MINPAKSLSEIDLKNDISGKRPVPPIFHINFMDENLIQYWNTAFGKFEHELFQRSVHPFSDVKSKQV
jgi:hypothetical protein